VILTFRAENGLYVLRSPNAKTDDDEAGLHYNPAGRDANVRRIPKKGEVATQARAELQARRHAASSEATKGKAAGAAAPASAAPSVANAKASGSYVGRSSRSGHQA